MKFFFVIDANRQHNPSSWETFTFPSFKSAINFADSRHHFLKKGHILFIGSSVEDYSKLLEKFSKPYIPPVPIQVGDYVNAMFYPSRFYDGTVMEIKAGHARIKVDVLGELWWTPLVCCIATTPFSPTI